MDTSYDIIKFFLNEDPLNYDRFVIRLAAPRDCVCVCQISLLQPL